MIEIERVTKRYDNLIALNEVSLSIPQGGVLGLLGPNGAGKSTLFKIIAGLLNADQGRIYPRSGGWPYTAYKSDRLIFPNDLSVQEYLTMIAKIADVGRQELPLVVSESLERVNLGTAAKKKIKDLSKGMRQRLGLAQLMVGRAQLLLIDEPTDGLDQLGQIEIRQQIQQLKEEGKTIIVSSHQLDEMTAICTHIAILGQGKLRYSNNMADALALRPRMIIRVDKSLAPLAALIHAMHPDLSFSEKELVLGENTLHLRRQILTMLLGAGYDILHADYSHITLSEIYAEVLQ